MPQACKAACRLPHRCRCRCRCRCRQLAPLATWPSGHEQLGLITFYSAGMIEMKACKGGGGSQSDYSNARHCRMPHGSCSGGFGAAAGQALGPGQSSSSAVKSIALPCMAVSLSRLRALSAALLGDSHPCRASVEGREALVPVAGERPSAAWRPGACCAPGCPRLLACCPSALGRPAAPAP